MFAFTRYPESPLCNTHILAMPLIAAARECLCHRRCTFFLAPTRFFLSGFHFFPQQCLCCPSAWPFTIKKISIWPLACSRGCAFSCALRFCRKKQSGSIRNTTAFLKRSPRQGMIGKQLDVMFALDALPDSYTAIKLGSSFRQGTCWCPCEGKGGQSEGVIAGSPS